ncbi:(d)CMP kinase [Desulfococcaceae bacterium HSG7]|nr:(d)CMP kinase [Desulfococcaceae bacterium HSG9]MDM8557017.1 (d)CMP kinase [Desulfococcaceae bacterium HSG7]
MQKLLITLDGPAGAGKSTVSRKLAQRLGYRYIDTGALYRGVALVVSHSKIDPQDDLALEQLCASLKLEFRLIENNSAIFLNGAAIAHLIRTPAITALASTVASRPVVREHLLKLQLEMGRNKAAVFEGRDMGTVVFPQADIKFFLDASIKERALRRHNESGDQNDQTLTETELNIRQRDAQDANRLTAPLKSADDAVKIDSTRMSISEVVEFMLAKIKSEFDS